MSRLGGYTKILISRYRRTSPIRWLGEAALFVHSAYQNEGSDIKRNGESHLLEALAAGGFETAIDVGANYGEWLILAARSWKACRFYAFEVATPTFEELRARVTSAGLLNRATLNCAGLSDVQGNGEIFYYPEHPDITSHCHRHFDNKVV